MNYCLPRANRWCPNPFQVHGRGVVNLFEFQLIYREQKVIRLAVNVVYEFQLPLFVCLLFTFENAICGMSKIH